jgi:hypothetical protein
MNEANIDRVSRPENRLPPQANKSRFVLDEAELKKKKFTYDDYGGGLDSPRKMDEPDTQQTDFFGISQEVA